MTAARPTDNWSGLAGRLRRVLFPGATALVLLSVWTYLTAKRVVPHYLLPSPGGLIGELFQNHAYYASNTTRTLFEATLGMLLAALLGFIAGTIFVLSQTLERMVLPYALAIQAVPIVAIAPLLILWFGEGALSKVIMAAVICASPMLINATRGFKTVDTASLAMMRAFGASPWQVYLKLRLPSSVPFIVSGLKISAALAMIGAIVAEYEGADSGLGYVITQSTYRLDTPAVFASIVCAALGGWFLYFIVYVVESLFLGKYFSDRQDGG